MKALMLTVGVIVGFAAGLGVGIFLVDYDDEPRETTTAH